VPQPKRAIPGEREAPVVRCAGPPHVVGCPRAPLLPLLDRAVVALHGTGKRKREVDVLAYRGPEPLDPIDIEQAHRLSQVYAFRGISTACAINISSVEFRNVRWSALATVLSDARAFLRQVQAGWL
jgi:hypothetical protein